MIWRGERVILEEDTRSSGRRTPEATRAVTVVSVSALRQLRDRVRAMDVLRKDIAIAAIFCLVLTVEALFLAPTHGESRALTVLLGVPMVSALALRRTWPTLSIVWFGAGIVLQSAVGNNFLFDDTQVPFIAVVFMLYSGGRYGHGRAWWAALAFFDAALVLGIFTSRDGFDSEDIVWFVMVFWLPVVAGRALRSRVLLRRELQEKAERAEAERDARASQAIEEERDRIASELQAVVANGVSAMVIQAEAVPRLLAAEDTRSASLAFAAIEETGRDALSEMRRLLGVLRREDEGLALSPQPGLARLEALVERQRERGLDVELRVEGERRDLAIGVDLTAYRVLEDALQAALRQRAEHATVVLSFRGSDLHLEVGDDRAGGASARLPGLRDRVGLYGGHLSAGRENGHGFKLEARLPVDGVRR
jgi:signal transduction histidine kinase